jgi:hypothetical protein
MNGLHPQPSNTLGTCAATPQDEEKMRIEEYLFQKKALEILKKNRSVIFRYFIISQSYSASNKQSRIIDPPKNQKKIKPLLLPDRSISSNKSETEVEAEPVKLVPKNFICQNKDLNHNIMTIRKVDQLCKVRI